MNLKKIKYAIGLGVIMPMLAAAQPQKLSLQECLNIALKHNQTLAIARYEEQIGEQQIRETRSRALPQVNASANLTDNYKRQVLVMPPEFQMDGPIEVGLKYGATVSADASQALFDLASFTALKAAKAGREYYQYSTRQTEEDVIHQTAQVYYRILAVEEQIRAQDSNIVKLTSIISATRGQYENGLARKIDLDRIQVNLANANTQRVQLLNQEAALKANLKMLLGVSADTEIVPQEISLSDIEQKVETFAPLQGIDVQNRTEIQLVDAQIRLNELQTKARKAENYPRLSAFVNYNYNGVTNEFSHYFRPEGASSPLWYSMGAFGLRMTIPVFDGLGRNARTRQSIIQGQELRKRKEAVSLSLQSNYQQAQIQIANSIATIREQKQNVELASQVYNSSQSNYNLGLATLTDLLEAQTSYIQAQKSYTQALLDYKTAELETIRSSGNLRSLLQ